MRTWSSRLFALVATAALLGLPGAASAQDQEEGRICPICSRATEESAAYPQKMGYTLLRGTANTALGWTEIIRQPAAEVKAGGNVISGIAKGLGRSVQRTLAGAAEVLTFWTPRVQRNYIHFSDDCPVCMGRR